VRVILFEGQVESGQTVRVVQGDLTQEPVDAIVNAANGHLMHGGGVAGAISRRGGPSIQRESTTWVREHGAVRTGSAAITGAGNLACRYVIHAVGPVWQGDGTEPAALASAVRCALDLAEEYGLQSVSLPGISSGIFGFPKPLCAQVITRAVCEWFANHPQSAVQEVNACNIDARTANLFAEEAKRQLGAEW